MCHLSNLLICRCSTNTIVEVTKYDLTYKESDPVCHPITSLLEMLSVLPEQAIMEKEESALPFINHPSLSSEGQLYQKNKGMIKPIKSSMADLLKTYCELGNV